jgi:ABC-2 type transport system permease protein
MMFWTFLFSIILATLFNLAFSNIASHDLFKKIPISIVNNSEYKKDTGFQTAITGSKIFTITLSTKQQADNSLKNNKIDGYVLFENGPNIILKSSGINQTILKGFIDNYLQIYSSIEKIIAKNPGALPALISGKNFDGNYLKEVSPNKANPNYILTFFYALIAMSCLYGSFWGLKEVSAIQANLSNQGARLNLVPVHKLKIFAASLCSVSLIHICSTFLLVAYMNLILKIQFGNELPFVLLACIIGSITGVSMGAMISAVIKKGESFKVGILIAVSMVLSFLSGLMVADIKYLISKSVPILKYLNPASLIADAFYSLYYYNTHTVYFINIGLLAAFSVLFYLIVYFVMRRQKYASI